MKDDAKKWDSSTWNYIINRLNEGTQVDDLKIEMTDEQKKAYVKDLEALKEERKKNPDVPVGYWPVEKDWE